MGGKTYFTESAVRRYPPPTDLPQRDYVEKLKRGLSLVLRVSYGGTKAWRVLYYRKSEDGNLRAVSKTLGHYPELGVAAAR
jgi:hypothetical protein